MNIPQMFTRTSFCEHCANNGLPYVSSDQIKHHKLRFFVKKNGKLAPSDFDLRRQSKPGQLGYSPHLFFIEKKENNLFYGFKVCCIENCGVVITDESLGEVIFSFEHPKRCIWTQEELVQLYQYHDETFMLDTKETQVYISPEISTEIDPN
jgi:hypothetical protein